jgi:hypothetical protein
LPDAQRLGNPGLQWAGVDWLTDQQDSGWIDASRRPTMASQCDCYRKGTAGLVAPEPLANHRWRHCRPHRELYRAQAVQRQFANDLRSTHVRGSEMPGPVHSADPLKLWVAGKFQSPRLSPDEHDEQPIEALQLAAKKCVTPHSGLDKQCSHQES